MLYINLCKLAMISFVLYFATIESSFKSENQKVMSPRSQAIAGAYDFLSNGGMPSDAQIESQKYDLPAVFLATVVLEDFELDEKNVRNEIKQVHEIIQERIICKIKMKYKAILIKSLRKEQKRERKKIIDRTHANTSLKI